MAPESILSAGVLGVIDWVSLSAGTLVGVAGIVIAVVYARSQNRSLKRQGETLEEQRQSQDRQERSLEEQRQSQERQEQSLDEQRRSLEKQRHDLAAHGKKLDELGEDVQELRPLPPIRNALPPPRQGFVDREQDRAMIAQKLESASSPAPVVLVRGPPGIGKSELALQLAVDLGQPGYGMFEKGLLWVRLGPNPEPTEKLDQWWRQVIAADEENRVDTWARPNDDRLASDINSGIRERRVLFIIDDVWDFKDAELFVRARPSHCPMLLTSAEREVEHLVVSHYDAIAVEITKLNDEDSRRLLNELLGKRADDLPPEEREGALAWADGLPFALVQIGAYGAEHTLDSPVWQTAKGEPITPSELYGRRVETLDESSRTLLESVCALLPDFSAKEAAVATGLITLDSSDREASVAETACQAQLEQLAERAFLQLPVEDQDTDLFSLHRLAQEAIAGRVVHEHGDRAFEELHRRAITYWRWVMNPEHPTTKGMTAYQVARHRESAEWRRAAENLVHHLNHLRDRRAARLAFDSVYLEAFWWWGYYFDYEFLETLVQKRGLDEGPHSTQEDGEWLSWLRQFHEAYEAANRGGDADDFPAKPRWTKNDWGVVEDALRYMLELDGLNGNLSKLTDHDEWHVRALADIFLAHAYRYRSLSPARVDEQYAEARALFERCKANGHEECEWNLAWIDYEEADTALERGDTDLAWEKANEGIVRALAADDHATAMTSDRDELDCEIVVNCYRVCGDVLWLRDERDAALTAYGKCVLLAYAWQYLPQADPYTRAFYGEMLARVLERLEELRIGHGYADAEQAAEKIAGFTQQYAPTDSARAFETGRAPPPARRRSVGRCCRMCSNLLSSQARARRRSFRPGLRTNSKPRSPRFGSRHLPRHHRRGTWETQRTNEDPRKVRGCTARTCQPALRGSPRRFIPARGTGRALEGG